MQAVISTLEMHVFFVCVCFTESRSTATFQTFTPPTATTVSTETRKPLTTTRGTFVITDEASVFFLVSTARFSFKNFKDFCIVVVVSMFSVKFTLVSKSEHMWKKT